MHHSSRVQKSAEIQNSCPSYSKVRTQTRELISSLCRKCVYFILNCVLDHIRTHTLTVNYLVPSRTSVFVLSISPAVDPRQNKTAAASDVIIF
jgi:hypothetical protein